MTDNIPKPSQKLEEYELWRLVSHIAEECYARLQDFPDDDYAMKSKLQDRAFDVTSDVAEGFGSIDPRDASWYFGMARRSIFGIKNVLSLASKAGYIEVNPELMVEIERATTAIDAEIRKEIANIPAWYKEMDAKHKDHQT